MLAPDAYDEEGNVGVSRDVDAAVAAAGSGKSGRFAPDLQQLG